MKRNYEIDFLKFVFTIVIIVFHSKKLIGTTANPMLLPKGYLGVEFFFMVSGYLMMAGILRAEQKGIKQTPASFVGKKIKAFMPALIFAFVVNFLVWNICCFPKARTFEETMIALVYAVPELLFLRYSGLNFSTHFYNGPSWYISAMLLAMFVIYPFARKYKDKFACYASPIVSVCIYAWVSNSDAVNGLNATSEWLGIINGGFARAIAGLCLGTTIYYASEAVKRSPKQLNKGGNIVFGIVEALLIFCIYLFMRNNATKKYAQANDVACLVFIVLLLLLVFSKNYSFDKFFASKPMLSLYKLSLPLFLNQRVAIYYLNAKCSYMSFDEMLYWYLSATIVLSLLSIPASKGIEKFGAFLNKKMFRQ